MMVTARNMVSAQMMRRPGQCELRQSFALSVEKTFAAQSSMSQASNESLSLGTVMLYGAGYLTVGWRHSPVVSSTSVACEQNRVFTTRL